MTFVIPRTASSTTTHTESRYLDDTPSPDDCQAESHLRQRRYAATRIDLHRWSGDFLDVRTTKGDKTVPMTSAARRGKGHDLNAPCVVPVAWRAIAGARFSNYSSRHGALMQKPGGFRRRAPYLAGDCFGRPGHLPRVYRTRTRRRRRSRPRRCRTSSVSTIRRCSRSPAQPAHYATVLGADGVEVRDAHGHTSALGETPANVSIFQIGERAWFVIMPTDETFTVAFAATPEPASVHVCAPEEW